MAPTPQIFCIPALLACVLACPPDRCGAADVAAVWDGSFLNAWSEDSHWTTTPDLSPIVPDNGANTFEVSIPLGNVILDVLGGVTINNLDLVDSFLSGDQPLTIVGEAGAPTEVSTWQSATQNSEIRNTSGVNIGADATLELSGGFPKTLGQSAVEGATVSLTVDGALVLNGGGVLNAGGEGAVIGVAPAATFDWTSNASFGGVSSAAGVINNAGAFTKSAGAGLAQVGGNWTINNTGSFNVESGTLQFSSSASSLSNNGAVLVSGAGTELRVGGGGGTGSVTVDANAVLTINSSNTVVQYLLDGVGAVLDNSGTLNINGNVRFDNGASFVGAGPVNLNSGEVRGDTAVSIQNLDWAAGAIANTAGVTIPSGSTATISGGANKRLGDSGRLVVEGTVQVTGSGNLGTSAAAANPSELSIPLGGLFDIQTNADLTDNSQPDRGGLISNAGVFQKSAGTGTTQVEAAWTFNNTGLIDVDSGTLRLQSAFVHAGNGAIDVADGATIRFDAGVTGENSFAGEGTVLFNNDYAPGDSPAVVSFAGQVDFGADSDLFLEIGGTGIGEFDKLAITGDLSFEGDLHLSLIELVPEGGVFEPSAGDTFELISFGGALNSVDAFSSTTLPAAPAMTEWSLSVGNSSLILALNAIEGSGDFNGDNVVDAADYTLWRDNLGLGDGTPGSLALSDGDGNNDGFVDSDDYLLWRSQYGTTAAVALGLPHSAIPTPEPTSALLLMLPAAASARRRSR